MSGVFFFQPLFFFLFQPLDLELDPADEQAP
jgi:hypothetical protein